MGDALHAAVLDREEFTAPDGAVEAVACAVPHRSQIRAGYVVLRGASGGVGVMMLNLDDAKAGSPRPARRCVVGVEIADDGLGSEAIEAA